MFTVQFATLLIAAFFLKAHAGCGSWKTGTMSGYDNLDGADDQNPSCVADYCGINENFLQHVPVVSILQRDWDQYMYHNIEIQYKGRTGTVQSWDQCADADCGDDDPNCCTRNANHFANPGFLLDVEKRTLSRLFGLDYKNTLEKVQYRICDEFDPTSIAEQYGLDQ